MAEQGLEVAATAQSYRRTFVKGAILVVFMLLPLAYSGTILSTIAHEVLGHGGVALCLGGKLNSFQAKLSTVGYAWTELPPNATKWQEIAHLAGGVLVTDLFGLILLLVGLRVRKVIPSLILLILSFCFLLAGPAYDFLAAVDQHSHADMSRIIQLAEIPSLRAIVLCLSGLLTLAITWGLTALLFRTLERWLGRDGRLCGIYRAAVLAMLGLLPAAIWLLLQDSAEIFPTLGTLPNTCGASLHILCAASLYWIKFKPKPATISRWGSILGVAAVWTLSAATVGATALWLQDGVDVNRRSPLPDKFESFLNPTPSPSGDRIAVTILTKPKNESFTWRTQLCSMAGDVLMKIPGAAEFSWLPDGQSIVYKTELGSKSCQLWLMRLSDGSKRLLLENTVMDPPRVSPDGKSVAVVITPPTHEPGVWEGELTLIDLASGQRKAIASHVAPRTWGWGAEGKFLFFLREQRRPDRPSPVCNSVFEVQLSNGSERLLAQGKTTEELIFLLVASPDGKSLAFYQGERLCILDLSTGRIADRQKASLTRLLWGKQGLCCIQGVGEFKMDGSVISLCSSTGEEIVQWTESGWLISPCWLDQDHLLFVKNNESVVKFNIHTKEQRVVLELPK